MLDAFLKESYLWQTKQTAPRNRDSLARIQIMYLFGIETRQIMFLTTTTTTTNDYQSQQQRSVPSAEVLFSFMPSLLSSRFFYACLKKL